MTLSATVKLFDSFSAVAENISNKANGLAKKFEEVATKADTQAFKLNGLVKSVLGLAGAYISLKGVIGLVSLSDEYSGANASLSLISGSLEEQIELQEKVMQSAKRSRAVYTDVAGAVGKLKLLAGDTFSTNDEAIGFTETLNKALALSGADSQQKQAAFTQITQAMTSGRLQGDEFRSVNESAPMLADAIAEYMGKSKAELKELSSQGLITADIVKNALFKASVDIDEAFNKLPKKFSDIGVEIKNSMIKSFEPVFKRLENFLNSSTGEEFINILTSAISVGAGVLNLFIGGLELLANNISIITPLLLGLGAAWLVYNATAGVAYLRTMALIAAKGAKLVVDALEYASLLALIVAQNGFNAALAACPITWIIMALIAVVAIIYAAVAAFNKFTGKSVSATGIIIGVFTVLGSIVLNVFIRMYNAVAVFINFLANVFKNPIAGIKVLFLELSNNVLKTVANMIRSIETLINLIPGVKVNLTSGIDGLIGDIEAKISTVKDEAGFKDVVEQKNFISLEDGFKFGYGAGKGLDKKMSGLFKGSSISEKATNGLSAGDSSGTLGTASDPHHIKGNGKGGAVKVENEEDINLLRRLAERDYIARISQNTLAPNIKVEFSGPITKEADTDGLISRVSQSLKEIIETAPEGVPV